MDPPETNDRPSASEPGGRVTRDPVDWAVAAFALLAIALHDRVHVSQGRYWDAVWICNVAALLVGPAIVFRSPLLSAAALTWLAPGTVVWLADAVFAGSGILPTSYAVHLGGTAAAVYATRRSGFAERGYLAALAVLVASVVVSRYALPSTTNVNAAHSIPRGWGFLGSSRPAFVVSASVLVGLALALGRWLGRAVARERKRDAPAPR